MSTKRYKPEQTVNLLCKIEVEIANGKTTPQAARRVTSVLATIWELIGSVNTTALHRVYLGRRPFSGKPTFHSEYDRDAIDHVKIIDGIGTSQQLSEWQHVSVCKLHNQADRFRVRRAQLPRL